MKQIDVKDQAGLSIGRCLKLTAQGIRYRLVRSLITVVIVALAVAFLMMMLSTSYIDRQVAQDIHRRTNAQRLLADWVDTLTVPMNETNLAAKLSQACCGGAFWREVGKWGGLSDEQVARLHEVGLAEQDYERFLARLKPGERSSLIGSREGGAVFVFLSEPGRADEFLKDLKNVRGSFPGDKAQLQAFLKDFQSTADLRQRVLTGHAAAVAAMAQAIHGQKVTELLASDSAQTRDVLQRSGFFVDEIEFAVLQGQARLEVDATRLVGLLRYKAVRGAVARRESVSISELTPGIVFGIASSVKGATWLKEQMATALQENQNARKEMADALAKEGKTAPEIEKALVGITETTEPLDLSPERIAEVSQAELRNQKLSALESKLPAQDGPTLLGFSSMTAWLIIISFLVCVVGVANAMLMSVTERFREIATMKCLGALDSFIMIIFVLESSLQGLAGGLVGVVLGLLLGILHSLWGFGGLALANLPGATLGLAAIACLLSGIVLAALAAIYPAFVAARLAPMEAMRVE